MARAPAPSHPESIAGLTSDEVRARIDRGQVNAVRARTSRSTLDIIRSNVVTWFNLILGVLCALQLAFGSWRDALFGLVLVANSAIGITQELRAKFTLDRLTLVSAPRARVIRDGASAEVDVGAVVLDDIVSLSPGEQIVVDAEVVWSDGLEVDESLLTGESVPAEKDLGDRILSGSFVVAGSGLGRATAVGEESYARQIEGKGRRYTRTCSEVMSGINTILKRIGLLMVPVGALTLLSEARHAGNDVSYGIANMVAPLVAMVPEGLVLLSSIAFAVSAIALARRHVLANELPAVEGLARTDVVCTDKTGTLTEREPVFDRLELVPGAQGTEDDVRAALGALATFDPSPNPTARALAAALPAPHGWTAVTSVPFSSARKWSAADFGEEGVWVLGAPDVLLDASGHQDTVRDRLASLLEGGGRVVLLARSSAPLNGNALPGGLVPLAFVLLAEQLRPDAAETVRYLNEQGVGVKILSGDSPSTVAAIATAAGVAGAEHAVDARTLSDDRVALGCDGARDGLRTCHARAEVGHGGRAAGCWAFGLDDRRRRERRPCGEAGGPRHRNGFGRAGGEGSRADRPSRRPFRVLPRDHGRGSSRRCQCRAGREPLPHQERVGGPSRSRGGRAGRPVSLPASSDHARGKRDDRYPCLLLRSGSEHSAVQARFRSAGLEVRDSRRKRHHGRSSGRLLGRPIALDARRCPDVLHTLARPSGLGIITVFEWPLRGWRLAVVAGMSAGTALVFLVPFARDFFALTTLSWAALAAAFAIAALALGIVVLLTRSVRREVREARSCRCWAPGPRVAGQVTTGEAR